MLPIFRSLSVSAAIVGGFLVSTSTLSLAADPAVKKGGKNSAKASSPAKDDAPALNLLDAVRDGVVSVEAEGTGDGRMTLSVTNNTKRQLRVVLPPGLVASGATGQFGGMGGMGGGGGGMGGMGGGGMGGGMGGMGGMGF